MCYESWIERNRETDAMRKARKEADKMIEKARVPGARPEPAPPPEKQPALEDEQAA